MSINNVKHASAVAAYTEDLLVPATPSLTHAYDNSSACGLPMIAVSPAQGKFLSLLTSMSGSRQVLELGTLGGYSTIWFANAVKANGGKVTSVEVEPHNREVAIANLEHAGLRKGAEFEILLGPGLDIFPKLLEDIDSGKRERFDFIFIDADWDNQWQYFDWAVRVCKGKGSVIYVDNVVRQLLEIGAIGPEKNDETVVNLVEKAGKDRRVEAVVMQTVGAKDYDGFLMAIVK